MYAAPDPRALRCWCGNTLAMKYRLSENPCDTTCLDSQPKNCTTRYNIKVFKTGMTGWIPYTGHDQYIMLTCPCNVDSHTPHVFTIKLGFTGVYISYFCPKILVRNALLTCTKNLCLEPKCEIKKESTFSLHAHSNEVESKYGSTLS